MRSTRGRPAPDELIGTREAARIARVAQNTVNHWIRTKRLKRVKTTPNGYRFRAAELYALLEDAHAVVETRRVWRRRNGGRAGS